MNSKLIAQVAISLLMARWKQTLVAAIGVTFSITMFISLLSFMGGLNKLLDGLILNRTPHIRLYHEITPSPQQPITLAPAYRGAYHFISSVKPKNQRLEIYNSSMIMAALANDDRVLGVAPKITTQVFYNVGRMDLSGVINGVDVDNENRLFRFSEYVISGNFMDLKNSGNSIILGSGIAEKMLVQPGDMVNITTAKGEQVKLKVAGTFQSGIRDVDNVQSYCSIGTTQKIMGVSSNYITDLQVKLKEVNMAPAVAKEYEQLFNINSMDIQTANAQFETGSFIRTLISYAVGVTLLIVAGFGIYNILNMMIYEKMDSIAILKATGFSGKDVNRVFITIAASIGVAGGAVGLLCGFGISCLIDMIPFNTASLPSVKTYPIEYNPKFYLIAGLFSVVTTYLAGYFPARKASNIDPVIIIRGK